MHFQHAGDIWRDYPELVAGVLFVEGITPTVSVEERIARFTDIARLRLAGASRGAPTEEGNPGGRSGPGKRGAAAEAPSGEALLPEIQAWRRTFGKMGIKPTQYRCASEALLRRFRQDGALPRIHPLIDLCNAVSLAFAIPVAVFDVAKITAYLEVRYAGGDESYETFAGEIEHPAIGEVIFADGARRAHARRWTNRQSGLSAVRATTSSALIVAEAMHESARDDIPRLVDAVAGELTAVWGAHPQASTLSASSPRFEF
jgi:DNA/RNA-binding domain of Phe-tRNA-synthetase-like protein